MRVELGKIILETIVGCDGDCKDFDHKVCLSCPLIIACEADTLKTDSETLEAAKFKLRQLRESNHGLPL